MLIHIADSKSGFGDDFDHSILECYNLFSGVELSMRSDFCYYYLDNMAQKPLFYVHFWRLFGQTLLGHNIAMATPKIPGNQKLFERVCYI